MVEQRTIDSAHYIFTTGKLIHDQILKIQSQHLSCCDAGPLTDLSVAQMHVIRVIRSHGELAMSELAEQMDVSPPSASAMVDRLVEKGVLCREHSMEDRRKVVVRISPEAERMAEEVEAGILQLFIDLVEKLGPDTAAQWCRVLERVKTVLGQDAGKSVAISVTPLAFQQRVNRLHEAPAQQLLVAAVRNQPCWATFEEPGQVKAMDCR